MKWKELGLAFILFIGIFAVNPAGAIDDDCEWYGSLYGTDYGIHWDSWSRVATSSIPSEYSTNRALYIANTGYASGYAKTPLMNIDYFAFTLRDFITYTTVSGKNPSEFYIKYYNRENALIGTINVFTHGETYDDGHRWEFKKDENGVVDLYIDGSYLQTYTLDSTDTIGYIMVQCIGGSYTGYTSGNPYTYYKGSRAKIDDISSTGSIVGSREEWDDTTTEVVTASYALDYYNYHSGSTYEMKLIDTSDFDVIATTTPSSSTGFFSLNRTQYFGTNYGLYKYVLLRDDVEVAYKYITYLPTVSYGTITFDQEHYVSGETATISYSISSPDFVTYSYSAELIDVNGEEFSTEEIAEASGSYDVDFTDYDTGTYFVLFSRTHKTTGETMLYAYDYCYINEAFKFEGNTLLFNGTTVGSTDVSILQGSTYFNTTSDAEGVYGSADLSVGVATTLGATATGMSMESFTVTPELPGVVDLDLILFPDDMTDYWGANNTTAYGLVYGTHHAPVSGATVTIYNDTWTDTTTTSSTGHYAFHGLVNNSSYSVNATKTGFLDSTDYPITTNNNVRQDIGLSELFTVTINAKESLMSSPILTFTAVFDGTAYDSSAGGEVIITGVQAGIYPLAVGSDGYYTYSSNVAVLGDTSVTATLTSSTSSGSSSGSITGSFTEPHTSEFIYLSYLMSRYPGVDVTIYEGHEDDVISGGVPSSSAVEVASMTTGDTGAVTFEVNKSSMYTLYAVSEDPAFTKITSLAPQDSRYYIFVGVNPFSSDDEGPVDNIYYGTIGGKLNMSVAQINASFQDTSNSTVLAEWWINDSLDNQIYYSSTTNNYSSWSTMVDVDENETYYVHFEIDSGTLTEPKHITKLYRFYPTVHPSFDFGFEEQWQYNAIAAFFIIIIAGLFSVRDSHFGAVVAVILGWFSVWIGYIEPTTTSGLSMTFATMIAGMMYLRKQERY